MSTSYLVNIVANDFKDGSGIFDPFLLDQEAPDTTNGVLNGLKETAREVVNGLTNGH